MSESSNQPKTPVEAVSSEAGATNENPTAQALTGISDLEACAEAILFAAGYPVRYQKLSEILGLSPADIRKLLEHMQPRFDDAATSGLRLLLLPDTAQLCTKEAFAPYIREALGVKRGGNLSASSLEVLAVIAYNQPVTRTFVDTVRGVDSSYAVGSLLDKGLIEAVGRLEVVGRPMLYATTDKFLRVFGIRSLTELPATEALSVAAKADEEKQSDSQAEPREDVTAPNGPSSTPSPTPAGAIEVPEKNATNPA